MQYRPLEPQPRPAPQRATETVRRRDSPRQTGLVPDVEAFQSRAAEQDTVYYTRVHTRLKQKQDELVALAIRFEPKDAVFGVSKDQPRPSMSELVNPDGRQMFFHVRRRYDEALSAMSGYAYSPQRAYFDRDPYGTGVLRFEAGVTLLNSLPSHDVWRGSLRADAALPLPVSWWSSPADATSSIVASLARELGQPPPSERLAGDAGRFFVDLHTRMLILSRGARLDAFFAMLERRQHLTQVALLSPLCVFVGEEVAPAVIASLPRRPPRPPERYLPIHRHRRVCFATNSFGPTPANARQPAADTYVLCVTIAEVGRVPESGQEQLTFYTLCAGPSVAADPHGRDTEWRRRVAADVRARWNRLLARESYRIFSDDQRRAADLLRLPPHDPPASPRWPMPCPRGDAQMIHRLAILLESPTIMDYAPWEREPLYPSMDLELLLVTAPPQGITTTTTQGWTPELWTQYVLMSRIYPYVLTGRADMVRWHRDRQVDSGAVAMSPAEYRSLAASVVPIGARQAAAAAHTPDLDPDPKLLMLRALEIIHGYDSEPGGATSLIGPKVAKDLATGRVSLDAMLDTKRLIAIPVPLASSSLRVGHTGPWIATDPTASAAAARVTERYYQRRHQHDDDNADTGMDVGALHEYLRVRADDAVKYPVSAAFRQFLDMHPNCDRDYPEAGSKGAGTELLWRIEPTAVVGAALRWLGQYPGLAAALMKDQ